MPSPETLNYWDYVAKAFHWKIRLPLLGHMPLNKLALAAFAILGFAAPPLWLLGLALEGAYLLFLPGSDRFQKTVQKLIRGEQLLKAQETWAQREQQMLAGLSLEDQRRYGRLWERCAGLQRSSAGGDALIKVEQLAAGGLTQLLWIFLKLLHSRSRIQDILESTSRRQLEKEIEALNGKLAQEAEGSAVAKSLRGTLEIQQRRLENYDKAAESLKVTEAELDRIEKQITLLAEETAITADPSLMSSRLDGVVQSLQGTTRWMSENAEFFGSLEEEPPPVNLLQGPPRTPEGG
jgi:hypothetical protein